MKKKTTANSYMLLYEYITYRNELKMGRLYKVPDNKTLQMKY